MNHAQLGQLIDRIFQEIRELNATKGHEYATQVDALANFKRRADEAGIAPLQAWAVLFGKHGDAIMSYVRKGHTLSEPIDTRILDAILYLCLLYGLIEEERNMETGKALRAVILGGLTDPDPELEQDGRNAPE